MFVRTYIHHCLASKIWLLRENLPCQTENSRKISYHSRDPNFSTLATLCKMCDHGRCFTVSHSATKVRHIEVSTNIADPCSWYFPWASYQIRKITGCACCGNAGNVFPVTAGQRSRHASRHVCDARAVMHAGIANYQFPLQPVAGKTFPASPVHAQPAILRIW